MDCRAKRKEIKGKQDQVVELLDEVEGKLAKLQAEEERVIAKIKALQEKLDTNADYRATASITRDMEGQVKRQKNIAIEQDELLERQIKVDNLAEQVAQALAKTDHAEAHHTESFKQKGGAIKAHIGELETKRAELIAQASTRPWAQRYEALRAEKNGVAVSRLEDDHCTACRSTILDGHARQVAQGRRDRRMSQLPSHDGRLVRGGGCLVILLGVTGCIAAYKSCEILRLLQKAGHDVKVVMTEHATEFVGPTTFRALSGHEVAVGLFDEPGDPIHHVSLAKEPDVFLVAPATANVIAKIARGVADDLLTTTALATKVPLVIAPAMNVEMWRDVVTQENICHARGARLHHRVSR